MENVAKSEAPEIKDSAWYQPRAAMHAIRELMQNPEDTAQVFRIIKAMSGPSRAKSFKRFCKTSVGRRVLAAHSGLYADWRLPG